MPQWLHDTGAREAVHGHVPPGLLQARGHVPGRRTRSHFSSGVPPKPHWRASRGPAGEAFIGDRRARAACGQILRASLSDEQLALRALHARLSVQAQRGAFDEPDGTLWGVGTADALAEAFIAFVPMQTAE